MSRFEGRKYKKGKLPLFVQVYEILYRDIMDGKYETGEKLPGENDLAEQLNVSRSTLRQALMFLQEDRLIGNKQGIGNFVLHSPDKTSQGIEALSNNVVDYCHYQITDIQHKLIFQPPNQKQRDELKIDSKDLVAFLESYFYTDEKIVALDMLFIPYSLIAEHELDLEEPGNIYTFYTSLMQEQEFTAETEIEVVDARESTAKKMGIKGGAPLMMVEEEIAGSKKPMIKRRTYLLANYFRLPLQRRNDRLISSIPQINTNE